MSASAGAAEEREERERERAGVAHEREGDRMNNSDEGRSCGLPRFQALFGSPRPSERGVRFGLLLASLSLLAPRSALSSFIIGGGGRPPTTRRLHSRSAIDNKNQEDWELDNKGGISCGDHFNRRI